MGEFLYKIGQRTGPAPKIRKIGAVKMGMEQTPVIFKGKPFIVESMSDAHIFIMSAVTRIHILFFAKRNVICL